MNQDPRIGTEVGGYRIEAVLGRGGMGIVYLATQRHPKRQVSLKLLIPELAHDEAFRKRFLLESNTAAAIDHPNIVPIYDAGEADGVLYIAMRYVQGTDLRALLRAEAPLGLTRAVSIVSQVGSALDAAHEQGLVHRDVKPGNVLVIPGGGAEGDDFCYLTDFGITRRAASEESLTRTGQIVGTVDYVAPEQIEGIPLDGRADIYSLGCVLYECLTGHVPFPRPTDLATLYAHLHEEPPRPSAERPDLPPALDDIVARALAKSRDERFATCRELSEALRAAMSGGGTRVESRSAATVRVRPLPALARPSEAETVPQAAVPARRRDRHVVVAAVLLALLPLSSLGLALARRDQPAFPHITVESTTSPARVGRYSEIAYGDGDDSSGIDIKQATIATTSTGITMVLTTYGKPDLSGNVRIQIDSTRNLQDGCYGYEWVVYANRDGAWLRRLDENCETRSVVKIVGRIDLQRTVLILPAALLPEDFPRSFRWHVIADAAGYRDNVPDAPDETVKLGV